MEGVALCEECRDFLQSNHDEKWHRFEDSPGCERSVSKVLEAADMGCRLCEAVIHKFGSLQPGLLSFAQTNAHLITFRLLIIPNYNTNLQWEEDIDRPFLRASISQHQIEFRLWRVPDIPTAGAAYDGHGTDGTGSEASFARATEWLRECILEHGNCNEVNTPKDWAPSRLIDVGSSSPYPDTIKLRQTKDWQQKSIQYAALSHCWGAVQPYKLLQSNLRALMDGISAVDLPKTFQDAVYATRKFGIQYLWIDSLCIIQDSSEDWDFESSLMAYVYSGCQLNLAAASSSDCTGGLFQNRPPSYLGSCFISVESQNDAATSCYQLWDQGSWPADFESSKLNTRAWVMQERMLSPRTLAFSKAQVFWECRCKRASEEFPSEYPIELFEKRHRNFEQPQLQNKLKIHALNHYADSRLGDHVSRHSLAWHNLVMLYSKKDMTFEQDKLVAISGLADLFAMQMDTDYLAGLWKSTLLKDLLWEADAGNSTTTRPLNYRAPSWSWASVKCPVKYLPGSLLSIEATVIDVGIQTVSQRNRFGGVSSGYLRLQGKLFPDLRVVFDKGPRFSLKKRGSNDDALVACCTPDEQVRSTDTPVELVCLPIGPYVDFTWANPHYHHCKGLLLVAQRNLSRGYYKRWGIFEAVEPDFFKDSYNQASIEFYIDGSESMIVIL